ncbi:MAG: hypothetical protein M1831_000003 [Alyxoria varia]|nr:MAG: hypothetical protein M1831_000003 [Alyxoria varia]
MPLPVQQAKVKSVLSGDTVQLVAINNPKNERILSLAFVSAPRLRRDDEERGAVESRDFARKVLVGKVVQFRVLYTLPTGNQRDYGQVTLRDGSQLPELSVAEGWCKVRDDAGRREEGDEATSLIAKLRVLESRAKADGKGIWDSSASFIKTMYDLSSPQEFVQEWKSRPMDAIVEKVLTGDRVIARLMHTSTQHVQTILLIAGIRTPSTKRTNAADGQDTSAEQYGDEAFDFVDERLMQRRVSVTLLGLSAQNQLVGSIKHPNGDIALFVLKAGLGRCLDQHSTMLGSGMALMRQAEKYAREHKEGQFKGTVTPKANGGNQTDAVVSRVFSADTLFLRSHSGTEKRINLTSTRQPKPSDPKQAPWGAEAKEFMRKRLIGKHVKVAIDGKRPATEGYEEREMATILHGNSNVSLPLVEAGLASVIRHRMDDPDRSPVYDDLLAAEAAAQADQKGIWSPQPPEAKQYVDYSENLEKAKRLFTLLSRQKRISGVVDFVKGASRFALLIPRENAKITLVLSGIQAPRSARNPTETSEPFGKEAHELASKRLQQRDVEIDVDDTDKNGGFIGKLYIKGENFAKALLEEGFATVRAYSAEKSGNANELFAAEQKAKDARKGLWHDYDPSQEAADAAAGEEEAQRNEAVNGDQSGGGTALASPSKDYRDVVVTHVDDSCRLKVQQVGRSTTDALSSLMKSLRQFYLTPSNAQPLANPSGVPKVGEYVAAKFSADGEWYRGRVRRNDRDAKTAEIVYSDYGNSESVPWSELRQLSTQFGVNALKTQAVEAALSFVQFPSGSQEYMREAQQWLMQRLVNDKQLVARVDHTDARDGTLWVSLFDPEEATSAGQDKQMDVETASVNAQAVEEGLGMVGRKLSRWEKAQAPAIEGLRLKEEEAKKQRLGMWEYGDLTED